MNEIKVEVRRGVKFITTWCPVTVQGIGVIEERHCF